MNIKVCGITSAKQLQQLEALHADFAGLVFYKDSPRYARGKINADELRNADFDLKKTGVFVNAPLSEIIDTVDEYQLDVVQLHGDESPELCDDVSALAEVIKVFSIDGSVKNIDEKLAAYDTVCDYFLFDNQSADAGGGTGKKFDWKKIATAKIEKPFFLSGGIGPEDAALLKSFRHPDFFAVDINSRFEKEPGVKDMALILKFFHSLK